MSPELAVLILNCAVIATAYFFVYPKYCGSNGHKIAMNDAIASGITLFIAGVGFWGSNVEFTIIFTTVNWFWFTLISYVIIETPLMLWYYKKHKVWSSFNS